MMSTLSIRLLGALEIVYKGEPADFATEAARALLAHLAAETDRRIPRETLAGLLWPEILDSNALKSLRNTLYRLRNAIGDREADPPHLLISPTALRINPAGDVWVDVNAFREHVEAAKQHAHATSELCAECVAHLTAATELYRGEFLQGFSYPSPEYEAWIVTQRESLHVQVLEALDRLTAHQLQREAHAEALSYARRQIELEPWREKAHRQAMRALALSEQRAAAVAQYETCRATLEAELGIEPEAATKALYEQIRRGELSPPVPPISAPPMRPVTREEVGVTTAGSAPPTAPAVAEGADRLPARIPELAPPSVHEPGPRGEPLPDGERRITTLVVAEVRGAEALLRRAGLEVWAEELHQIVGSLQAEVARYGGTVLRRRDAGLVAAFGAEVAHEDDTERAVLAALGMADAFRAAQDDALAKGEAAELTLSVGVTTGEAVVLAQDEGGVAVHAAALAEVEGLQAQVPPDTVWVTEATYRRVEERFEWAWLGEARGAGRAPARLYRPVSPVSTPAEHDVGGLRAPLVGREAELHSLVRAVARVKGGIGGIVTVVGEAGIGKSRLVAETKSRVASPRSTVDGASFGTPGTETDRGKVRWAEGRWLSYTEGVAYYGWQELLRRLLGLTDDCTETGCVLLEERIAAFCPGQVDAVYPYLARLLALPVDAATAAQLDSLVAAGLLQSAIFRAVTDLLTRVAEAQPLVLVLEDLHWADEASLALIERLLPLTDQMSLLILTGFRPARDRGCWRVREIAERDYGHRHIDIRLVPLSVEDRTTLVRQLLAVGEREVPEQVVDTVARRAEGNPFFTAELVRSLLDQGTMADTMPFTVRGVLMARIDRLPVAARQVLQLAAVVGRTFRYQVLADIVLGEEETPGVNVLDAALLELVRAQLIHEEARVPEPAALLRGERTYTFEHQLTLEAAYGGLLHSKRRVLHQRVAETLERLYPEQVDVRLGLLAHHWEQAGEMAKAIRYRRRAGEQAASLYANMEAIEHFTRALALVPGDDNETRYELLLTRERLHHRVGDRDAQTRDLDDLQALAKRLGDARRTAKVTARRAEQAILTHHMDAALEVAEAAVELAQKAGDASLEALTYLRLAQAQTDPGGSASPEAIDNLRRALDLAQSVGLPRLEAEILQELGMHLARDRHAEARELLHQALASYREVGDRAGEGAAIFTLALSYGVAGGHTKARALGLEALEIHKSTGSRWYECEGQMGTGYHAMCLGLYDEALDHYTVAESRCREIGATAFESRAFVGRGIVLDALGDYETAWANFEKALAFSTARAGLLTRAWGLAHAGLSLCHRGEAEDAQIYAQEVIALLDNAGDYALHGWLPHLRASAHIVMGHALLQMDNHDAAISAYREGLEVRRISGPPGAPVEMWAGIARAYLSQGKMAAALAEVERILIYLKTGHLQGTMEPLRTHLTCYQVLAAAGDFRAAQVLSQAYDELMARASTIEEEALRRSYLENVAVNREIVAAWTRLKDQVS